MRPGLRDRSRIPEDPGFWRCLLSESLPLRPVSFPGELSLSPCHPSAVRGPSPRHWLRFPRLGSNLLKSAKNRCGGLSGKARAWTAEQDFRGTTVGSPETHVAAAKIHGIL